MRNIISFLTIEALKNYLEKTPDIKPLLFTIYIEKKDNKWNKRKQNRKTQDSIAMNYENLSHWLPKYQNIKPINLSKIFEVDKNV